MADNWDPELEQQYGLALAPVMKELADEVKRRLPPGTHFGVLVLVPSSDPDALGRTLAITSDRRVVAAAAGQWVLTVFQDG